MERKNAVAEQSLWAVGLENLRHRLWMSWQGALALGGEFWYWRLGYALWLEGLRGSARHAPSSSSDWTYGETPLWTAFRLLQWAHAQPGQRLVEVGCGRGIVSLVAASVWGMPSVGLEALGERADKARWLVRALQLERIRIETSQVRAQVEEADLYFLTPTTWSEENWRGVVQALEGAPPGARALVLTQPIPGWEILKEERFPYSWGWCKTFLQKKEGPEIGA